MFGRQTNFLKEVDALLEKGFTQEQITAMFTSSAAMPTPAADSPDSGDDANPLADSPGSSADTPAAAPETPREENNNTNSEILAAIDDLKKSVQANNIKTMSVETVNADAALESAMAELIRPSFETKGD